MLGGSRQNTRSRFGRRPGTAQFNSNDGLESLAVDRQTAPSRQQRLDVAVANRVRLVGKLSPSRVELENMRQVTWCVIDEVNSGDWAIGGQCLTTEAVHSLAAGVPATA